MGLNFAQAHATLVDLLGTSSTQHDWLKECTHPWKRNIHKIGETTGKYPQESYDAVVRSIQSEWMF